MGRKPAPSRRIGSLLQTRMSGRRQTLAAEQKETRLTRQHAKDNAQDYVTKFLTLSVVLPEPA